MGANSEQMWFRIHPSLPLTHYLFATLQFSLHLLFLSALLRVLLLELQLLLSPALCIHHSLVLQLLCTMGAGIK